MEPPAEEAEQLCVFLLRAAVEEEEVKRREVACQWESPQQQSKEVACQSDSAEHRDAAVQVDLLTQQLSWSHSGESAPVVCQQLRHLTCCCSVCPSDLMDHTGALCWSIAPPPPPEPEPEPSNLLSDSRPHSFQSLEPRRDPLLRTTTPAHGTRRLHAAANAHGTPGHLTLSRRRRTQETQVIPAGLQVQVKVRDWFHFDSVSSSKETAASPESVWRDSNSQHALVAVKLEVDSIVCDVCGKVMKNKSSLARHSFIHTGKKPFACHLCELRFNRRDNLQHHLNRLHPHGVTRLEKQRAAPAWLCATCGKTFSCRSRLKTHEVIHSGVKPHRCDLCPKAYMRTNDLEHHKKIVHVEGVATTPRPSSLLCDFCGKEFKCRSQLVVHLQTHTGERPHLCDICGRKFARQHQLKRHKILTHANHENGDEPPTPDTSFACSVCGKQLKSEAHLAAHSHAHTDEKPHRCGVCLRSFQRATCLKQHHLRVHLKVRANNAARGVSRNRRSAAQAKTFPCSVCGKVFKFKSLLTSHSLIHSEVRPHACDFCSRCFRRRSHLKRHREVVHANGARAPQSFVCHICGKDKKCRSQLDRHVIIHTGERPFACDLCSARFNRRGNLQQHRRRMHTVGESPTEEAPPILFDNDMILTYKQEETVVTAHTSTEELEVSANEDDNTDDAQQIHTS